MESNVKGKKKGMLPQLAHEIVVEILSRLPVKSLLRFRCVCKLWRTQIMDPQFASTHLNRSSQTPGAIFWSIDTSPPGKLPFHTIDHEFKVVGSVQDIDYLPWKENCTSNYFKVVGSCNGLLAIWCSSKIFIWNPLTRYCKKIKNPLVSHSHSYLFGLGYNSDVDNFKLVIAFESNNPRKRYANIFSFKSNSWKEIESSSCDRCYRPYGALPTLVNGVPHWKFWFHDVPAKNILSFDLVEDRFKEVPLPDWILKDDVIWQLLNYNGWLCTMTRPRICPNIASFEVCAMKEYGIKDSWSTIFIIPILGKLMRVVSDQYCLVPWYFTRSGEILLQRPCERELFIYNPKEGTCELAFCSKSGLLWSPFVESLVSPICFESM